MATLKQFNYLISIVEEGGFIAASEKLFIAQSALSRQIKLLEEEVGFEIFDRADKKIKLTKAGQFFYAQLKNNVLNLEHIIENSKDIANGKNRLIKIAHSSTITMSLEKVKVFDQASKDLEVHFELNTLSSEDQVLALKTGHIDVGFIRPPVLNHLDELHMVKLYHEPLYVALHLNHMLAIEKSIKIQQLRHENFVSTPHAERGGLSYLVSNLCLSAGFTPKKAPIQSRKVSQLQLVAAEIGVCIVPEEFTEILPEQVKLIPLQAANSLSDVVMVWSQNADEVIQKSTEYLLHHLQR
ncbi:LysR substrate-binding domain-containing protein [Acinetobacter tibetensis]|uniref:LysR substrate-binding domain-containing protein n=1 Tax=Acinetobacter tibetensis TaxID=2943497 RepID=A0AAE9S0X9_9GAMM|nr:LysR substrate-binding domain-containing protein [Acinetobacter tibetensis]USE83753.1 LysR substrate-binding domain-containing protein [Acinetobacter tibetensis]